VVALRALDVLPAAIGVHAETLFASDPNRYSVIVAAALATLMVQRAMFARRRL
jgi:hypothetical protein